MKTIKFTVPKSRDLHSTLRAAIPIYISVSRDSGITALVGAQRREYLAARSSSCR